MKTILLKFAGPLQSWGTSSYFETRHTDFYPSKSGVIGLLAACMGYRRDEDAKVQKLNELDFAVRIDQPGRLLKDYHTAEKIKANGEVDRTYVTNRYYLEDAVFVVALSHSDKKFINSLEEGLRYPYFQPYMGRRALPLNADFLIEITDESALESLKRCEWQASEWYKKKWHNGKVTLDIYSDQDIAESNLKNIRKDRVISFSQKERKFAFRLESVTNTVINDDNTSTNTEHDFWDKIGE